jgi:hypothetical protein
MSAKVYTLIEVEVFSSRLNASILQARIKTLQVYNRSISRLTLYHVYIFLNVAMWHHTIDS